MEHARQTQENPQVIIAGDFNKNATQVRKWATKNQLWLTQGAKEEHVTHYNTFQRKHQQLDYILTNCPYQNTYGDKEFATLSDHRPLHSNILVEERID